MDLLQFWTTCSMNGIVLDAEQREQIKRYYNELIYWNEKVNMISRKDVENVLERHLLHSISCLKYIKLKPKAMCMDIGTGGGLPGIPIKIAEPEVKMFLVDSIGKKIKLTDMFAFHTGLKHIVALSTRVEELAQNRQFAGNVDYIFARGVATLDKLADWSLPLLKKDGQMIFYKGGNLTEEINGAKQKFPNLKIEVVDIDLIGSDYFKNEEKKILFCKFKN